MNRKDALDMFPRNDGARCIEIGRQIQSYADAAAAAKVSNHLDACRRCGLSVDDYRRLKVALAESSAPIPAEPLQRVQAFAAGLASGDTSTS